MQNHAGTCDHFWPQLLKVKIVIAELIGAEKLQT